MLAVRGAAEVNFRIENLVSAFTAGSLAVILKEFNIIATMRARGFENFRAPPISVILSWALHV